MNSTVLKHALDANFSDFKKEMSEEINSRIKERLDVAKEGLPNLINKELGLSETGPEDKDPEGDGVELEDEDSEDTDENEDEE